MNSAVNLRPIKWNDVIGQDKVVLGLKNGIKNKTLSNTIAFVGSSGCGKSTLARLTAMALNCEHLDKDGNPCCECQSCKDIINERYCRDLKIYNGSDVTADEIRNIANDISYNAQYDENKIYIFEEAQLIKEPKRLLQLVETNKKNLYFIFTSTDTKKFSNTWGSDNSTQEKNAFRSRMTFFSIKSLTTNDLGDMLFKMVEKDPKGENYPDVFFDEGLITLAEGSKGNIRNAINDYYTATSSECFDRQSIIDLLGYEDEKKEYEMVGYLAEKSKDFLTFILNFSDVESFFNYSWKIISDNLMREISGIQFKEQWKEKSYNAFVKCGTLKQLADLYAETNRMCSGYFKSNVFFSQLYNYYNSKSSTNVVNRLEETNSITETPIVKKVKKIAK